MDNRLPQASPSITFGRGGFVEQVTYAPSSSMSAAQPDSACSMSNHNGAIQSMAAPSFTPDVPFSSPMAATSSNTEEVCVPIIASSAEMFPNGDDNVGSSSDNNSGRRGKVFSHVEKNEIYPTRSFSPVSPSAALNDCVDRVVTAVESREANARESSLAYGTNNNNDSPYSPDAVESSMGMGMGMGGGHHQDSAFDEAACHGGPFSSVELNELSFHCTAAGSSGNPDDIGTPQSKGHLGAWASIDGDLLATLTPMLQAHVKSALGVDLVGEGRKVISKSMEAQTQKNRRPTITINQWMMQIGKYAGPDSAPLGSLGTQGEFEPGGGHRRLQVLLSGLESANILLAIMASPGIDRRAVEDDAIEACVNLIKNHIQKHVSPSLSNTGHLGIIAAPAPTKDDDENDFDYDMENSTPKPKAKRYKTVSPNRGTVAKGLKAVYGPLLSTVGTFGTIMERAEAFIVVNEMDDRLLFTLSAAALSSLTIEASTVVRADVGSLASIVQVSAMDLIAAMFSRYPRHRSIIVEDLFPLMLKLPTSKRSLRTYLVKKSVASSRSSSSSSSGGLCVSVKKDHPQSTVGDHDYIQPICALVLLLIQSCVVMPYQSDKDAPPDEGDADAHGEDDDEERLAARANDTSGLDGCVAVCNQFISQMMQRCCRKGEEGGASEFRPILSNLIDDLLLVRYLIEFPAAEMLLLSLSHRLGSDLIRASSHSKQVEATYLATAMDAFGKITSAVASTLQQNRENPFKLPDSMSPEDSPEPQEEVNRCFCGRGNLDTFMVDCDRCHSWFHGSCIGITKDTVPDMWFCDDCTLQTAILDQAKVFARSNGGSKVLSTKDHNHVLRQFLLSYLSRTAESSSLPHADRAREFLIATWVKYLTLENNSGKQGTFDLNLVRSHVVAQWSPLSVEQNNRSNSSLTADGNQRIMSALVASSELSASFPRLLGVLLKLMGDKIASLRKLSLKAFLQVVNVDPTLMSQPSVRKEVSRCFHDGAISVREAAVSLVGDYVLQSPNLAAAFHAPLLERMVDSGISVRKRAVKIFRDILLSNPSYGGRATAMHCMLQRADDRKEDDGVRDLIHEAFHILWFNGKAFEMGKSSLSLATDIKLEDPNNRGKTMTRAQLYCREAAKAMVEVVKVSGSPEFLTSLVKGLLFGFNEGDKNKKTAERMRRQVDSRNQCNSLVLALVELLLSFEESRAHTEEDGKELVALLSTLSVFSQAYPELLVPHVDTLVPYLKGDNGANKYETLIVSTVSSIVSLSSRHFSSAELARLTQGELPTDLVNIAYKFPPSAVSSAVEALSNLANHPDASTGSLQEKKLFNMAVKFYTYLLKNKNKTKNFSTMKKAFRHNVQRALSALGSICRYYECHDGFDHHNLDPNGFHVITDVNQLQFSGNVLSSACFALFREYLENDDEQTKCLALRAMNGVFISRPRVVLAAAQLGIISFVISEAAPPSVQIESLRCWRDILLAEEIRIESGAAKQKMQMQKDISLSKRISGDQDGDSCISGSVLTKHADRLYELTLSKDEKVRQMIIDLIGHLLRQGLINPMATVPHLLAVQGDVKSPATRSLALKLLITEGEKRPDMLRQRICAGLKQAYYFQKEVYPHDSSGVPRVTALLSRDEGHKVVTDTIFDQVIKESAIRNKRAQRQGLLKGIISLFEKDPDSEHTDADQLPLLAFASEILAHLPYTALNDPLFIVYHLSCITALDGQSIINQFAELLGGDLCDPNSEEDDIERAAKTGTFDPNQFGLQPKSAEFGQLCVNACRILPLLQLKNFLCEAYNLSEARITEYVPSEKERIHEKGVSISDSIPAFSCIMDPIFDSQQNINWNNAGKVYAMMRPMMRDSEDEDLHVDTEPLKKTPKRKSGQKRKLGDFDDALAQDSPKVSPD